MGRSTQHRRLLASSTHFAAALELNSSRFEAIAARVS
jgi:hypothetical protein